MTLNPKAARGTAFLFRRKLRIYFFLIACVMFTGCGITQKNELFDYRVDILEKEENRNEESAVSQDYLSEGICVIPKNGQTKKQDSILKATATMVVNDTDGQMLYSHNIYKKVYPASITKIVTALVAFKYGNLEDVVTVSYNASHITERGATLCGFEEGDKIVLRDLLSSFLVRSGNDAGIAIAEHISGSVKKFANLMNREMQNLGAVHSHFVNPHGLHDDNHYTTAYDLYLVFHELTKNQTFLDIVNQPSYTAKFRGKDKKKKKLQFTSTDRYLIGLAKPPKGITVIGGKTGTTFMAGSCLILYSRKADDTHYVSVVLKAENGDDLYRQMNRLLKYAVKSKSKPPA